MDREALRSATREALKQSPAIGRYELAAHLGVSEWAARELLRELRTEPVGPSVAYFDLETTALIGDLGQLLCGSILSYPSMEMITYRLDQIKDKEDFSDDRALAIAIRDKLEEHHILVGYFSKGFDVAFLNTRLAYHGQRMLSPRWHLDPIWSFRGWRGLKPRSSKMKVVAEFLKLEQKQDVDIDVWRKCLSQAAGGNSEMLDTICDRCESDVRITADIAMWVLDNKCPKSLQMYP